MKNLAKDERIQTLAMIGGLLGLGALIVNLAKSQPVANVLASLRSKAGV